MGRQGKARQVMSVCLFTKGAGLGGEGETDVGGDRRVCLLRWVWWLGCGWGTGWDGMGWDGVRYAMLC